MTTKKSYSILLLFSLLLLSVNNLLAQQNINQPIELSNNDLKIIYDRNSLSLWKPGSIAPFIEGISFIPKSDKSVEIKNVNNSVWGEGSELIIQEDSGNIIQISLYKSLSFVLVKRVINNNSKEELKISKHELIEGKINLGGSPEKLNTISMAGLKSIKENSGGYVYMAVGDPSSYEGVVFGWLTSERGGGIVFSDFKQNNAYLKANIDYGDLRISVGKSAETEILMIGYAEDVRTKLEHYADAIAKYMNISLKPMPTVYCTWYHGGASDEKKIALNADFASERLKPFGFHVMQIDDYWQLGVKENGPRRNFTNVRPDGPYPSGMKPAADYLRLKGFVPGIWYIPFAGSWNDPFWQDKMDLFLKEGTSPDNHFSKMESSKNTNYPKGEAPYEARWGGTCLDLTNPKAIEYVYSTANRLSNDWGYKYFKVDGLFTGVGVRNQYINSGYQDDDLGTQIRLNPSITPIEAYVNGLKTIRKGAGDDVFILGCCLPQNMRSFSPAIGRVDAMRVGPDNGANARLLIRGPQFTSRVFFLNKRVWYNDPDPVYVRKSFPLEMARTSVSWVAISGSMHSSSEQYPLLPKDRLDILLSSIPSHGLKTAWPVDFLENDPASIWLLTDDSQGNRKDVIGLFNWDVTKAVNISYPLEKINIPKAQKYVGFDYWADRFIPPFSGNISGLLPPGGCKIISIRTVKDYPQVVSTSRHVTQGVIDLTNEKWSKENNKLSGTSELVGNDSYEIRIVVPSGSKSWMVKSVELKSPVGKTSTSFIQLGSCIRVKINSSVNQKVDWVVEFEDKYVANKEYPFAEVESVIDIDRIILNWKSGPPFQYQITRNGIVLGDVSGESFIDYEIQLGQTYKYGILAKTWDGRVIRESEITVDVPAKYTIPEQPPLPDIYCSELNLANTAEIKINQTFSGNKIILNGVEQKNGIGTKGVSTLHYNIPEGSKRFVATVGFDETIHKLPKAKLVFTVMGDVLEMGEPVTVLSKSPLLNVSEYSSWHFNVELDSRMKQVRLMVEAVDEESKEANIEWINAGFIK